MIRIQIRIFCCALLFVCAACSGKIYRPKFEGEILAEGPRSEFVTKVLAADQEVSSFRSLSHAKNEIHSEKSTLRYAILFERPDKLRIEALPLNSAYALTVLISNGDRLVALDPASKTAYLGKSDAENLSKVLNLRLDAVSLIPLIAGRLPSEVQTALHDLNKSQIKVDRSANLLRVSIDDFKYYLEFDAQTLLLKTFQAQDKFHSKLSLQLSYADYRDFSGITLPTHIDLEMPKDQIKIELHFAEPSVNKNLAAKFFNLDLPEGYKSKKL